MGYKPTCKMRNSKIPRRTHGENLDDFELIDDFLGRTSKA